MTRDYKPRERKQPARQTVPGWLWLLTGLLTGLLIAFLVYLSDRFPAGTQNPPVPRNIAPAEPRGINGPAAQSDRSPPARRFDFYTLLPEMEVAIPDEPAAGGRSDAGLRPITLTGTYILQAGSFRKFGEADRLRASLALLGFESQIQSVIIQRNETWHRVRIGPYQDLERLNKDRKRLRSNDINVILIKLKG